MVRLGERDSRGNLLVLGGWKANLWRSPTNMYFIGGNLTKSPGRAIEYYNQLNNTNIGLKYIQENFEPYLAKLNCEEVFDVPSNTTEGVIYKVRKHSDGSITCDCKGFMYRADCWHAQQVREYLKERREE